MSVAAASVAPLARVALDSASMERDLGRLVLTLIELLRRVMEAQALRRVDAGTVTEEEAERLGLALRDLRSAVLGLCGRFGLRPEELNIDLGPLGRLL